jgi:predicted PurR-regulated permease PerM
VANSAARVLAWPAWITAIVAVLWLLRAAADLLIPIAVSVCISYALEPVVSRLARHMPRIAATCVVMVVILGLLGWGAYILRDEANMAIGGIRDAAMRVQALATRYFGRSAGDASPIASPATLVQQGIGPLMTMAGDLITVVFLLFFLLASGDHFRRRIIEIVHEPARRDTTARIISDIDAQVQQFLLVRAATGAGVALATWLALLWLDTPQAGVWAVLAGVFNSIPYFGPVIVSGGLLLVGLAQSGDLVRAFEMSAAALVITSIEGWLVTPPLLGRTEQMNAVVVFVGLLIWTWMWGAWGTLLAVPMLVVIKAVADHVERLRPLARLMAP